MLQKYVGTGINSYIVGCKCEEESEYIERYLRINSYIVGCKYVIALLIKPFLTELIVT